MNTITKLLALGLFVVGCGDNKSSPDAGGARDARTPDALCSNCPAAPVIGTTQIDRMGRPAINTALNNTFNTNTTAANTAKDAYNANTDRSTWQSFVAEFSANLAVYDSLDGMCGNSVGYNSQGSNNEGAYGNAAGLLTDDRLYLDTSRGECSFYLAVEFGVVTGGGNTTCGGRAPEYDVIDFSYSALVAGVFGFSQDGTFTPAIQDGADAHDDLLETFPYLGPPHAP